MFTELNNSTENLSLIYSYTRAQAIEDGALVDVSELAKEAGFNYPVAVTRSVWDKYIYWTEKDTNRQTLQDTNGRLWDLLFVLRGRIRMSKDNGPQIAFPILVIPRGGKGVKPKLTTLKSIVHGGDDLEPVITISLPNED